MALENGARVPLNYAINSIVSDLSSTLLMEARKNEWAETTGEIVLPSLVEVPEDSVRDAERMMTLARSWEAWGRFEEQHRLLGLPIASYRAPNLPPNLPSSVKELTAIATRMDEWFDWAANQHLIDAMVQLRAQLIGLQQSEGKVPLSSITKRTDLPPAGYLNFMELLTLNTLNAMLRYRVSVDQERPAGLRLVEWIRGYAVLAELSTNARASDPRKFLTIWTRETLMETLLRCGMPSTSADRFIEVATLTTRSDDVSDAPLVRLADGTFLIFGPAVEAANLPLIVLSSLLTLNTPLSRKGHALEEWLLSILNRDDRQARRFKFSRDSEEFEYDSVLAWGDRVFVFECKSLGLSNYRPRLAFNFINEMRGAKEQVLRLVEALKKYPDVLKTEMGIDVSSKTVVPVVVNALPYSRFGTMDGVYFAHSSAIELFFDIGQVQMGVNQQNPPNGAQPRIRIASLWQGAKPSPDDFMRQLEDPVALRILKSLTSQVPSMFFLSEEHAVTTPEFNRLEWNCAGGNRGALSRS